MERKEEPLVMPGFGSTEENCTENALRSSGVLAALWKLRTACSNWLCPAAKTQMQANESILSSRAGDFLADGQ